MLRIVKAWAEGREVRGKEAMEREIPETGESGARHISSLSPPPPVGAGDRSAWEGDK